MPSGPKSELTTLKRFIAELEIRYLNPHLTGRILGAPTRAETLDVAAFTVLTHGAIENFAEGLSLWVVTRLEQNWRLHKRSSRGTAMLMLSSKRETAEEDSALAVYDTLRLELDAAKTRRAREIKDNNGIAKKHLHALFSPLGVDVPADPVLIASLESLVSLRHEWAHQYRYGARNAKYASDVRQTAADCMKLAEMLVANVMALRL